MQSLAKKQARALSSRQASSSSVLIPKTYSEASCHQQTNLCSRRQQSASSLVARAGKIGDDVLDFIQAGPKMRKWYGQGERMPTDGGPEDPPPEEEAEEVEEGDGSTVFVLGADTPTGEQVVLQLILARASIKALVQNVAATKGAYGQYVKAVSVDANNAAALRKALKGASTVIVAGGQLGALPQVAQKAGVLHIILLSAAGLPAQGGVLGMFDSEMGALRDASREAAAEKAGVLLSVARVAAIRDAPGAQAKLLLVSGQQQGAQGRPVSREDLAAVLVAAVQQPPSSGPKRVFQVMDMGPGAPPEDLGYLFASLT